MSLLFVRNGKFIDGLESLQNDRCEAKIAICMQPAVVLCESDGKISIEMPCQRQSCVHKNAKYEKY